MSDFSKPIPLEITVANPEKLDHDCPIKEIVGYVDGHKMFAVELTPRVT